MATKSTLTKLTLKELLEQKEKYERKQDVKKVISLKRDEEELTIVIKKPSRALCLECLSMAQDPETQGNEDKHMVYSIVVEPNLKDASLQKAYECIEPTDIVDKIFDVGEIAQIAGLAMSLAGYGSEVKVLKDLKN